MRADAMIKIRAAQKKDAQKILAILKALDLYHPVKIPDDFFVAEINGEIAGVSCLADRGDFLFLSSVGVVPGHRQEGIARQMLQHILSGAKKDIYLYTIIPGFFKKFGFEIVKTPKFLPSREGLGCEDCRLPNCVCMRKTP